MTVDKLFPVNPIAMRILYPVLYLYSCTIRSYFTAAIVIPLLGVGCPLEWGIVCSIGCSAHLFRSVRFILKVGGGTSDYWISLLLLAVSRYCGWVGNVTSVPQGGPFRGIAQIDTLPIFRVLTTVPPHCVLYPEILGVVK